MPQDLVKKYRIIKGLYSKQTLLDHTDFFRNYLSNILATVPQSPLRLKITRPVAKDIKDTKRFTIHKYNKIASELRYIWKHNAQKIHVSRKKKGKVYIVKVEFYRELNQKELESKEKIKKTIFTYDGGDEITCRVACTINFQVQTKEDLAPYDKVIISIFDSDEFEEINDILTTTPIYKEKLAQCESWLIALKMTVIDTLEKADQIDLYDYEVYKSINGPQPKICCDYTDYKGETLHDAINSDVFTPYLTSSFKEYACFYTAIINTYPSLKIRIGSTRGSLTMNYDNLQSTSFLKGLNCQMTTAYQLTKP